MEWKCNREGERGRKSVSERARKRERERERATEIKCMWGREKANYPYLAAEQRCARIGRGHAYRDSSYRPPSFCGRARRELLSMVSGKEAGRERGSLSTNASERTGTALNAYTKLMPWLQQLSCAVHWEQTPSLCRCCLSSACSHIQSGSIFSRSTHWRCCSAAGVEMFTSHTRHWDTETLRSHSLAAGKTGALQVGCVKLNSLHCDTQIHIYSPRLYICKTKWKIFYIKLNLLDLLWHCLFLVQISKNS